MTYSDEQGFRFWVICHNKWLSEFVCHCLQKVIESIFLVRSVLLSVFAPTPLPFPCLSFRLSAAVPLSLPYPSLSLSLLSFRFSKVLIQTKQQHQQLKAKVNCFSITQVHKGSIEWFRLIRVRVCVCVVHALSFSSWAPAFRSLSLSRYDTKEFTNDPVAGSP